MIFTSLIFTRVIIFENLFLLLPHVGWVFLVGEVGGTGKRQL